MSDRPDPSWADLGKRLLGWLERSRGSELDIWIAGRVLGGKPGESSQFPRDLRFDGGTLVIYFDPTEMLTIIRPSGFLVVQSRELIIAEATEVNFGWHYYGRPQTPENWCTDNYRIEGDRVTQHFTGPIAQEVPPYGVFSRRGAPAVQLMPAW